MATSESPAWVDAATAAAVRLAAEAGTEVDDILEHAAGASRLTFQITRFEQSADLTEVATDLAGLLWAECEEVPLIATILEEPATQAALQAVAEARRQAARRLAEVANPAVQETPARAGADWPSPRAADPEPDPLGPRAAESEPDPLAPVTAEAEPDPLAPALAEIDDDAFPGLDPLPPLTPLPKAERWARSDSPAPPWPPTETSAPPWPPTETSAPAAAPAAAAAPPAPARPAATPAAPPPAASAPQTPAWAASSVPLARATRPARAIPTTGTMRPSTGAVLAGTAAAAILLFGRRLRRA